MSRDYRHLPLPGVSFAVDHKGGVARIAVALCHENDSYSRVTAKTILDLVLDAPDQTLNALNLTRNISTVWYCGKKPRGEVLDALVEHLVDVLNERALYRELRALFLLGITTEQKAREAAKAQKSEAIFKRFAQCAKILEAAGDLKLLAQAKNLKDFERLFFTWSGSAEAILDGIVKFACSFKDPNFKKPTTDAGAAPAGDTSSVTPAETPASSSEAEKPATAASGSQPVASLDPVN